MEVVRIATTGLVIIAHTIGLGGIANIVSQQITIPPVQIGIPKAPTPTPTPTPTPVPQQPVSPAKAETPGRPESPPGTEPATNPAPYACETNPIYGEETNLPEDIIGSITCCTYCYRDTDCPSDQYCTFDEERCNRRCVARPTPTPTRTPTPTPTPTPTYPPGFEPTPTPTPTFEPQCMSYGPLDWEEELLCCTYCPNDAYCGPGKYCKTDGCDTFCETNPPSPSPTVTKTPIPTTLGPSPTPTISPTQGSFQSYCLDRTETTWDDQENVVSCCYTCQTDADCGPRQTCVTSGDCGASCVNSAPTPPPTSTPQQSLPTATPYPTQAPKKQKPIALPGDLLYIPVDFRRDLLLFFTRDPQQKMKLHQDFAHEKLREVGFLLEKGNIQDAQKHLKNVEKELAATNGIIIELQETGDTSAQQTIGQTLTQDIQELQLLERMKSISPQAPEILATTETFLKESIVSVNTRVDSKEGLQQSFRNAFTKTKNPFLAAQHIDLINSIKNTLRKEAQEEADEIKGEAITSIQTYHRMTGGKNNKAFAAYLKEAGISPQTQGEILKKTGNPYGEADPLPSPSSPTEGFDWQSVFPPEALKEMEESLGPMLEQIRELCGKLPQNEAEAQECAQKILGGSFTIPQEDLSAPETGPIEVPTIDEGMNE